jgi:hypothetical protein
MKIDSSRAHSAALSASQVVAQSRSSRGFFATIFRWTPYVFRPRYRHKPHGTACRISGSMEVKKVTGASGSVHSEQQTCCSTGDFVIQPTSISLLADTDMQVPRIQITAVRILSRLWPPHSLTFVFVTNSHESVPCHHGILFWAILSRYNSATRLFL